MEKLPTTHVVKGLILSVVIIILSILIYFSNYKMEGWARFLVFAVFTAGVIISCIIYGKQLDNNASFSDTFAHGFKVSSVVSILMIAFVLIFSAYYPGMKAQLLDSMLEEMRKDPKVTQNMMDKSVANFNERYTPFLIGGTMIGYVFIGVLASLIGAAVTKRNLNNVK